MGHSHVRFGLNGTRSLIEPSNKRPHDNITIYISVKYLKIPFRGFLDAVAIAIYILISISTPAGSDKFVSASMTFGVGPYTSINRLCVRISNCSRDDLSIKDERFTVNFAISVGRGTGPIGIRSEERR